MRRTTFAALALGLMLAACGGSPPPADPTWSPSQRLPQLNAHWWWEPVERTCEEDEDCTGGPDGVRGTSDDDVEEHCQSVRLATCTAARCPRGEPQSICVPRNPSGANARADH